MNIKIEIEELELISFSDGFQIIPFLAVGNWRYLIGFSKTKQMLHVSFLWIVIVKKNLT
jgi:uncharacterized RDD family membrane protein YckC